MSELDETIETDIDRIADDAATNDGRVIVWAINELTRAVRDLNPHKAAIEAHEAAKGEGGASCGARVCTVDHTHGPHRHEDGVVHLTPDPSDSEREALLAIEGVLRNRKDGDHLAYTSRQLLDCVKGFRRTEATS